MRLFALATAITIAAASASVTGCTSPGLVFPWTAAPPQYSGAPNLAARDCGWQPGCAPTAVYPGGYAPPGPQVYSGGYAPPGPQVYPEPAPAPEPYSRRYDPPVYSSPTRPYWGDQSYGSTNRQ
jgi:hypothetical protein